MKSLFTLLSALLFTTVVFTAPVQAQQRTRQPHPQQVKQPRAFKKHFRERAMRMTRTRTRAMTNRRRAMPTNTRSRSPRFYTSKAASQYASRLKGKAHSRRTRANISPRRSMRASVNSAPAVTQRIKRAHQRRIQRSRSRASRAKPTFWK